MKCPNCNHLLEVVECWNSLLKMNKWYEYGCPHCGLVLNVKNPQEMQRE